MKTSKKAAHTQRKMMDVKIAPLSPLMQSPPPRSGWLKAIRGALGITTRQLAQRLGVTHQVVIRQEERETTGGASLEYMDRAARAMGCRFAYAILPAHPHESLESILDQQAMKLARRLAETVTHTMRLEDQGVTGDTTTQQIRELAQELKAKLDSRIWDEVSE